MWIDDVCLYFIFPCCAQLSRIGHVGWIVLRTILPFLLFDYHWKIDNLTAMVSNVNTLLTEQWLPMITTCLRSRHTIILSVLAALNPSFFPFYPLSLSISSSHDCVSLRHVGHCCSRTIYTYILTYTHIGLSCESRYYAASSVIYTYPYFSLPIIRIRQCWQTRILWSIHRTIIYHYYLLR